MIVLQLLPDLSPDFESERSITGMSENVVPSATKSRHLSPSAYFSIIVLQAAKRCLATSTPVTEPELPIRSNVIQSLAPEGKNNDK